MGVVCLRACVRSVPIKSAEDERSYRVLRLPNELVALLVSDAAAEKSAAALDVKVNSFLCVARARARWSVWLFFACPLERLAVPRALWSIVPRAACASF